MIREAVKRKQILSLFRQKVYQGASEKEFLDLLHNLNPKTVKGEKGDVGISPTRKELLDIIIPLLPEAIPGINGKDADEERIIKEVLQRIKLPKVKNGIDGTDGDNGKDGSPDSPREVLEKLLSLKDSDLEKLFSKISESKPFKELQGEVVSVRTKRGGHGSGLVKSYDLSTYLDGSTKTFTIPFNLTVIQITSSSAPFVFRETVDFTISGTARRTLTFTSAIDASSMLANGQTVKVIYAT